MEAVAYISKSGRPGYKQRMTEDEYHDCNESYTGFCLSCGSSRGSCEPDAAKYKCETCGEMRVYGLDNLLAMGLVEIATENGGETI